ncbi:MAG: GAF domain-containing protein [Halorubrum sp.]
MVSNRGDRIDRSGSGADHAGAGDGETDGSTKQNDTARVLVVDDEPGAADLAATYLERLLDEVETHTAASPAEAMNRLRTECIDCVVSDHDMPKATGLELLADVRDEIGDLPFILFTGKGSEEIASDAISAGVTDYLQKGGGADGYEMLANRVSNALSRRRAEANLRETNQKVTAIHEFATAVSDADEVDAVFDRVVDVAERILEFDRCVTARRHGAYVYPTALSRGVTDAEVRRFELGEGIAGRTVAEEQTFVIDELDRSEDADPVADDIGSAISVPIGGYGLLQAVSSRPSAFDETDVEFAELVAAHACEAIEQIETEAALRAERDRLAALFDNIPLAIARIVVDEDGTQRLDETNEAFEATFGHTADESDYREVRDAIAPNTARHVGPSVVDGGEAARMEVRRRTVDGVRDFILHAIPTGHGDDAVYSVYVDIDEQKRVERTLRGLHEATRRMFHGEDREEVAAVAARTAIDTLGFPNSGVRLYDPDTETLQPTEIPGEATEIVGDRPFGSGDGLIWEAFERDELQVVDDLQATETTIAYDGLRSLLVVPLDEYGVMPLGACEPAFFDDRDVQLARVLGANLTAALDRADRTEQLHERDAALQREIDRHERFSGVISHDLRSPLTVASGRLDLLRAAVDDDNDAAQTQIDHVENAHDRMAELIDDLLTLTRQGQTVDATVPVDVSDAAQEAWETVDTGSAVLDTPDTETTVDADPERLRTLLENLFQNSVTHGSTAAQPDPDGVEHTRASGQPSVTGEATSTDGGGDSRASTVTVSVLADGFSVADDGPGFDEVDPADATEYGVSGSEQGTGYGLAIVKEIANAHGWRMTIEDDEGVRFEFWTDE